ncbi:MAG: DUF4251 domain-containing protein [Flavobacteriaceae bacterium]|nr:DUF4251 domain-containing protein [Flavobacteriaceae bacterium]
MRPIIILFCLLLSVGCATNKQKLSDDQAMQRLDNIISSENFSINSTIAIPTNSSGLSAVSNVGLLGTGNSIGNINLADNPNYIKINNTQVDISMPYYGTQTVASYYASGSIVYKGICKGYTVKKDLRKNRYVVSFNLKHKSESLTFRIYIYSNLRTDIQLQSSHRSPIQYRGMVI